jgi:uncharacterized membrane protein YhaH (DUF805 family)
MLNFLFGFHGRVRRSHYFFATIAIGFVLGTLCASTILASGISLSDLRDGDLSYDFDPSPWGFGVSLLLGLVGFWSMLAITVKRWHDIGVTGWFSLLSLPGVTHFAVFLLLCLLPGTVGSNTYGSDPRGRAAPSPMLPAAPAAA